MKHFKLRFWHPIIGILILNTLYDTLQETINWSSTKHIGIWILLENSLPTAAGICYILLIYTIIRNAIQAIKKLMTRRSTKEAEELKHQREIERKEIDMVRKSNEILLHLIQDEHREEDR